MHVSYVCSCMRVRVYVLRAYVLRVYVLRVYVLACSHLSPDEQNYTLGVHEYP